MLTTWPQNPAAVFRPPRSFSLMRGRLPHFRAPTTRARRARSVSDAGTYGRVGARDSRPCPTDMRWGRALPGPRSRLHALPPSRTLHAVQHRQNGPSALRCALDDQSAARAVDDVHEVVSEGGGSGSTAFSCDVIDSSISLAAFKASRSSGQRHLPVRMTGNQSAWIHERGEAQPAIADENGASRVPIGS